MKSRVLLVLFVIITLIFLVSTSKLTSKLQHQFKTNLKPIAKKLPPPSELRKLLPFHSKSNDKNNQLVKKGDLMMMKIRRGFRIPLIPLENGVIVPGVHHWAYALSDTQIFHVVPPAWTATTVTIKTRKLYDTDYPNITNEGPNPRRMPLLKELSVTLAYRMSGMTLYYNYLRCNCRHYIDYVVYGRTFGWMWNPNVNAWPISKACPLHRRIRADMDLEHGRFNLEDGHGNKYPINPLPRKPNTTPDDDDEPELKSDNQDAGTGNFSPTVPHSGNSPGEQMSRIFVESSPREMFEHFPRKDSPKDTSPRGRVSRHSDSSPQKQMSEHFSPNSSPKDTYPGRRVSRQLDFYPQEHMSEHFSPNNSPKDTSPRGRVSRHFQDSSPRISEHFSPKDVSPQGRSPPAKRTHHYPRDPPCPPRKDPAPRKRSPRTKNLPPFTPIPFSKGS